MNTCTCTRVGVCVESPQPHLSSTRKRQSCPRRRGGLAHLWQTAPSQSQQAHTHPQNKLFLYMYLYKRAFFFFPPIHCFHRRLKRTPILPPTSQEHARPLFSNTKSRSGKVYFCHPPGQYQKPISALRRSWEGRKRQSSAWSLPAHRAVPTPRTRAAARRCRLPPGHGDEVQKQSPSILPWDVPRGTCPSRGWEPTPRWLRRSPRHRRPGSYRTPSLQPDPGQAVFQSCCKTSGATNPEGGPARSAQRNCSRSDT